MHGSALARYCARGEDYDDGFARAVAQYRMSWYHRHLHALETRAFERYGETVVNAFFDRVLLRREHAVVHVWRRGERARFTHRLEPYTLLRMVVPRYPREYRVGDYVFTTMLDSSVLDVRGKPCYQFECLGRDDEVWHFGVGHDATRPQTTPEALHARVREHGDDAPLPYHLKRYMDRYIKAPREGVLVLRYAMPFLQTQWEHWVGGDTPDELFTAIAAMETRLYESYVSASVESVTHLVSVGWLIAHAPELWQWVRGSPSWSEQLAWWRENGFLPSDMGDPLDGLEVQPTLGGEFVFRPAWVANLPVETARFDGLDEALTARVPASACDGVLVQADAQQGLARAVEWYGERAFRMAYIDPPYNLKTEVFAYNDRYDTDEWLCLVAERLAQARALLDDAGVCMVSIAHTEPALSSETVHLQMAASRIFPRRLGELIWRKRTHFGTKTQGVKNLSENHEYICLYGNTRARLHRVIERGDTDDFPESDEHGRYRWRNAHELPMFSIWKHSLYALNPTTQYDVLVDPAAQQVVGFRYRHDGSVLWATGDDNARARAVPARAPENGQWILSARRFMHEVAQGNARVVRADDTGDFVVQVRHRAPREPLRSILSDNPVPIGTTRHGRTELENELGACADSVRFRPKPISLLKVLVRAACADGERLMDFFAGTGTTALAAIDLRHERGERRPFLCIEESDTSFPVCVQRVARHMASPDWENGRMKPIRTDAPALMLVRVVRIAPWNPPD